jgi:hypothetical protein
VIVKRRLRLWVLLGVLVFVAYIFYTEFRPTWYPYYTRLRGRRTVPEALAGFREEAEARLGARFDAAGVPYPPERVTFLVFKAEKQLELWSTGGGRRRYVHAYPVLAASGHAGPKLREGDRQVPEGRYRVLDLNPNSAYHLSVLLNYPNTWDHEQALADGRSQPGGDIFIHGRDVSIGCIAVGDEAIEELFLLAAELGVRNVTVLIAPNDLRGRRPAHTHPANPPWTAELYAQLRRELSRFQRPEP